MRVEFWRYYNGYKSANYGAHCLAFKDTQGNEFYYSYNTLVAFYVAKTGKKFCIKNYWGNTTGKHLNAIEPDKSRRCDSEEFSQLYQLAFNNGA
jgi:hypothetical protein